MHLLSAVLRDFLVPGYPPKLLSLYLWGVSVLRSAPALLLWLKHPHQKLSFTTTAPLDALAVLVILTQSWAPH